MSFPFLGKIDPAIKFDTPFFKYLNARMVQNNIKKNVEHPGIF
jgi:hypothetical protein